MAFSMSEPKLPQIFMKDIVQKSVLESLYYSNCIFYEYVPVYPKWVIYESSEIGIRCKCDEILFVR